MQPRNGSADSTHLERLRAFVEHLPVAAAMLDHDLRYLFASRQWLKDYVLDNQDLIGRFHYEVFPPFHTQEMENVEEGIARSQDEEGNGDREDKGEGKQLLFPNYPVSDALHRWQKIYALCLAGETQASDSDYFIRPDGSRARVKWTISPWHTSTGEIGGVIMVTEFLESCSSFAPSWQEAREGNSPQDGFRLREVSPNENRSATTNRALPLSANELTLTLTIAPPAGEKSQSAHNISSYLSTTATEGIWGTAALTKTIEQLQQEIAERRQAQALQQESEERYRSLIAALAEGIILQDTTGVIHAYNAAAERILELSTARLMGRSAIDSRWRTIAEDGTPFPREEYPIELTLRTGQPLTDVVMGIYKTDGSLTWLSVNSQPLFRPNETKPYAAVASFSDITKRIQMEVALRESEERFRTTFEQAAMGISHASIEGRFVRVNQKFCDILGYTREELLERTFQDITHPDDLQGDMEYVRSLLAGERETYSLEKRYLHKEGQAIWVQITASLVRTPQGTPKYFLCVIQDISDRKAAELALRQSEARLREQAQREALLNRLSNQIRNSLELNTILETTAREIRRMLHIDRCQIGWYHPHEAEPYWEVVKEARNPELSDLTGRYPVRQVKPLTEHLLQLETLRVDDVETLGDPFLQQLLCSLGYTSMLVLPMQTPSGTIGASAQLDAIAFIACSHSSEPRPWSDSEVELLQAVMGQLSIAINQAELYAASRRATRTAREHATELEQTLYQLQRTQAQLIQSEKMSSLGQLVAGVAHEINNPVNFIYGNVIYAQEYCQDLLHLVELYRTAYPNPPGFIQDYIDSIELDFLMTDLIHLQDSMKVGAERIKEIVRSLRTFSRLDESERKLVDLHSGIESTLMILQHRLKGKPGSASISLVREYGDLPLVECCPGQLNQVFMNLLTNAIDALEEKIKQSETTANLSEIGDRSPPTVTITTGFVGRDATGEWNWNSEQTNQSPTCSARECVSVTQSDSKAPVSARRDREAGSKSDRVFIRIADNGLGMTEKTRQQLFDPFFTTKPVGKGTGLGLAISYQIVVEKHGGQLRCNSAPGQGAEFVIEIPLAPGRG